MAKSISSNKRELEKKKQSKKLEKLKRKEERKATGGRSFDEMIAYVDENGMISDTPPDPVNKQVIDVDSIAVSTPKKGEVEDPILTGRVDYFNDDKGYGFIKTAGNVDKYFFHISSAPSNIAEGNMVAFELERGPKGMNAVRITLSNPNDQIINN